MFRASKATHLRMESKSHKNRISKLSPNLELNLEHLKAALSLSKNVSIPLWGKQFQKISPSRSRSSSQPMTLLTQDQSSILISLQSELVHASNTVQLQMISHHLKEEFHLCRSMRVELHRVFSGRLQWQHHKTSRCKHRHALNSELWFSH